MKLWAGRPKDASGQKVAPVEVPVEPVVDPKLMGTAYEPTEKPKRTRTPRTK